MITIELTKGKTCIIDNIDIDLKEFNWVSRCASKSIYAYRHISTPNHRVHMHRYIMERILNRSLRKGEHVDHIDHNGLNNCRNNLRLANSKENSYNRRKCIHSSIYKGVSWNKRDSNWRVRIRIDGKLLSLGGYKNERDAAKAYNDVAIKYFGEYACLNTL